VLSMPSKTLSPGRDFVLLDTAPADGVWAGAAKPTKTHMTAAMANDVTKRKHISFVAQVVNLRPPFFARLNRGNAS